MQIGVATCEPAIALVRSADQTLYTAREACRNQVTQQRGLVH
ncbi:MAG: hypothetical protein ACM3KD_08710 [Hyphomicrobiaceae bacterium]